MIMIIKCQSRSCVTIPTYPNTRNTLQLYAWQEPCKNIQRAPGLRLTGFGNRTFILLRTAVMRSAQNACKTMHRAEHPVLPKSPSINEADLNNARRVQSALTKPTPAAASPNPSRQQPHQTHPGSILTCPSRVSIGAPKNLVMMEPLLKRSFTMAY